MKSRPVDQTNLESGVVHPLERLETSQKQSNLRLVEIGLVSFVTAVSPSVKIFLN